MKHFKRLILTLISIALLMFISCTPLKRQIYIQDTQGLGDTISYKLCEHTIQSGDLIYVKIAGLEKESFEIFNLGLENMQANLNELKMFVNSYTVSDTGTITLPVVGSVALAGLAVDSARKKVQESLDAYIKNSIVVLKHVNFKITVLGEVLRPQHFLVYDESINLLQAIGKAGDLTANANKRNVKIIRNGEKKTIEIGKIDLTCRDFIESDYFFLKPNDVVYVEPVRAKNYATNPLAITTLLSILTTGLLIFNVISK